MKKRIFSRLMAMVMAVTLLSTSALAFDINQAYIDSLKEETDSDGYSFVTLKEGDSNYNLVEDVKTNYTLKFSGNDTNATLNLNGFTIDHQGKDGSVIWISDGASLVIEDSSEEGTGTITGGAGTKVIGDSNSIGNGYDGKTVGGGVLMGESNVSLTMTGGNIVGNNADYGGGVYAQGNLSLNDVTIADNNSYHSGGGLYLQDCSKVDISNSTISKNTANQGSGGGIWAVTGKTTITDSTISENTARYGGGIYRFAGSSLKMSGGSFIGNTSKEGSKTNYGGTFDDSVIVCANSDGEPHVPEIDAGNDATCTTGGLTTGSHCSHCNTILEKQEVIPATGHTEGAPVRENEVAAQPGMSGSYDEVIYCTECGEELSRSTRPTPALPMPIDFGDFTGGTNTGTTIDDETTPLAGIVTEAQLLDELYKHEGSPAVEIVEKYASHEYAPAISWALANAIVVDDEDFDPDEVVTVALLREVLESYVAFKGIDFTVTVDGEDDELVLDLSERLTVFFAQLEK